MRIVLILAAGLALSIASLPHAKPAQCVWCSVRNCGAGVACDAGCVCVSAGPASSACVPAE
jgi:hypothetical protein